MKFKWLMPICITLMGASDRMVHAAYLPPAIVPAPVTVTADAVAVTADTAGDWNPDMDWPDQDIQEVEWTWVPDNPGDPAPPYVVLHEFSASLGAVASQAENWSSTAAYAADAYGVLEHNGTQEQLPLFDARFYTGADEPVINNHGGSTSTPLLSITVEFGQNTVTASRLTDAGTSVLAAVAENNTGSASASVGQTTCRTTDFRVMVLP